MIVSDEIRREQFLEKRCHRYDGPGKVSNLRNALSPRVIESLNLRLLKLRHFLVTLFRYA